MYRRMIAPRLRRLLFGAFLLMALVGFSLNSGPPPTAQAAMNGLALTPLLGWSSWSLTGSHVSGYGKSWLNAQSIKAQSDAMHKTLQIHGYRYINIDAFWYQDFTKVVDPFGRWTFDPQRFPNGIIDVANYVHHNGQKLGLYLVPGMPIPAVNQNTPIEGTTCHANDAVVHPLAPGNHFKNTYKMDFSTPCAQAYINSVANQLHSWGVDFLKLDAVAPGSGVPGFDTRADVQAFATALAPHHIWLELSSSLDISLISTWQSLSNGWRIDGDIECYGHCPGQLTNWDHVSRRFNDAPKWAQFAGPGGWNDLDSLNVGNGSMDGLTQDERQSAATLWAIEKAPLYTGDDMTKLDSFGLSLLTNNEVILINQLGGVATPISQATNQQVWRARNFDGSYTVALFNLGPSPASVGVSWSDLGLSGSHFVRDLWGHHNLGFLSDGFTTTLNTHASMLLWVK